jgi:CheY-specific phosphatase CheX
MICISFHCRYSNKYDDRYTYQQDQDCIENLGGHDTPDLPNAPCRTTTPKISHHIATRSDVYTPEGDKPQQNYGTNTGNEHIGNTEDSCQEGYPEYINIDTATLPQDNKSSDLPSYDGEMSLEYETPGLTSTESESHKGSDIFGITGTVESPIVTSEEIYSLLEHGANAVIAALNDSLAHDNEPSVLPSYDEMSIEFEAPGLTSTETESHNGSDIFGITGTVESPIVISEEICSLLEHGSNAVIAALNDSLAHDNEPSDIPSYDKEMSIEYEAPGLTSTETESHKGSEIFGITRTVESPIVTSEEIYSLLEHGANAVIAALNDSLAHDNEPSDLPSYDKEMSLEYEAPGLTCTESESHTGFDISWITENVESTILTSEEIQTLLEHGFDAFIAALSDPVPHDNESSVLPIHDDEISLKYETPGLASTESESHKGFDIESTILTSEEIQCLLEQGLDTFIAALNNQVPHDNESSDLPIYDEEMSPEYVTPKFTFTECELHEIPDICRAGEIMEYVHVILERIESMLVHANISIGANGDS